MSLGVSFSLLGFGLHQDEQNSAVEISVLGLAYK